MNALQALKSGKLVVLAEMIASGDPQRRSGKSQRTGEPYDMVQRRHVVLVDNRHVLEVEQTMDTPKSGNLADLPQPPKKGVAVVVFLKPRVYTTKAGGAKLTYDATEIHPFDA